MKIKLKQHIMEGTGIKCGRKRNPEWFPPRVEQVPGGDGKMVKTLVESDQPQYTLTPFIAGAVIDVSDATGKKWVEKGLAEEVKDEKQETSPAKAPQNVAETKPEEVVKLPRRKP